MSAFLLANPPFVVLLLTEGPICSICEADSARGLYLVVQPRKLTYSTNDRRPFAMLPPLFSGSSAIVSDVVEHSQLDLDMQKLEAAADEFDFATAYEEYSVGGER